jgi:hypothetical protein
LKFKFAFVFLVAAGGFVATVVAGGFFVDFATLLPRRRE